MHQNVFIYSKNEPKTYCTGKSTPNKHIWIIFSSSCQYFDFHIFMNLDSFWYDYMNKTSYMMIRYIKTCLFTLKTNQKHVVHDNQPLINTYGSYFHHHINILIFTSSWILIHFNMIAQIKHHKMIRYTSERVYLL